MQLIMSYDQAINYLVRSIAVLDKQEIKTKNSLEKTNQAILQNPFSQNSIDVHDVYVRELKNINRDKQHLDKIISKIEFFTPLNVVFDEDTMSTILGIIINE